MVDFVEEEISSHPQVDEAKTDEVLTTRALILARLIDCILEWPESDEKPTEPFTFKVSESRQCKSEITDGYPTTLS